MSYCEDCGCRTSGGICSNCQEELYILTYQGEHVESVSPEFTQRADEQEQLLASRKEHERTSGKNQVRENTAESEMEEEG